MSRGDKSHELFHLASRGQTAVGAAYALTFMLLIVSGILTFGYVYVTTPAISATDTTPEASTIGDELVSEELALDTTTARSASGSHIDPAKAEDFFIDGDTDAVASHRVIDNSDLNWNVSLVAADSSNPETIFDGKQRLSAGEPTPIGGVSTYQREAILSGDVVIIEVKLWQ